MTKYSNITGLMDEYVRNVKHIDNEQIKIVKEGFDLIKKKFEIDIIEYEWLISIFGDKRKRAEIILEEITGKITGKRFVEIKEEHSEYIKRLNAIIADSEKLIKDAQEGILENDKMKTAFERAIEYTDKKEK